MQIIGFIKFSGKDGRKFAKLFVSVPFSDFDRRNTCFGNKCREIFIASEILIDKISALHVGKEIVPHFIENDWGKAELTDYDLVD